MPKLLCRVTALSHSRIRRIRLNYNPWFDGILPSHSKLTGRDEILFNKLIPNLFVNEFEHTPYCDMNDVNVIVYELNVYELTVYPVHSRRVKDSPV